MGDATAGPQPVSYKDDKKTAVITVDGELDKIKNIPENVKVFVTKVRSN